MSQTPLFARLEQFLDYFQAIRERSPLTIREYRYDLVQFFRFLLRRRGMAAADTPLEEIDVSGIDDTLLRSVRLTDLYAYMTWLSRERRCGPAARARQTAAIKAFFAYLKNKAFVLEENPALELESPRQLRQLPRHLSLDESRQLLDTADNPDNPRASRDVCILTLFLNCGLRLSELCSIDLADIREDTLVVLGKGGKERTIYLNGACIDALEDYLSERPSAALKDPQALFISRLRRRISPKTVQLLLKNYLLQAGLDPRRYSVHKLRHTAATLMYKYGKVDIRALQQILGHASVATTEIYTHIDNESLHQAVEANPLNQHRPGRRRSAKSGV